ncbi:McrC family protein [Acinetobacter rathckeae]|uniref:McrC family protein n=1 Tax=Acinetobacter rathckeae TaxID=2605272 RepID=UPI0018A3041F|nr:McrC family protein [Acinetobacter rathckeae]MBF7694729.1 McrC family protein [Acinetobacter rathckeae]
MKSITVREYARLIAVDQPTASNNTIDKAEISKDVFEYLYQLNNSLSMQGQSFLQLGKTPTELCIQNFVGVIQAQCGTEIEILPKHENCVTRAEDARKILIRMLTQVLKLPQRDVGTASISTFKVSLSDWIFEQFLFEINQLYRIGLRSDYLRIEEEQYFLKGQLNTVVQMRKPLSKQHEFSIRHDIFSLNRSENRLIRRCIDLICKQAQQPHVWQDAHRFHLLFKEIPPSANVIQDFKHWREDRLASHYKKIKYWCQLILGEQVPFAVKGGQYGKSLLFPMEKLFEKYVEIQIYQHKEPTAILSSQLKTYSLAHYTHNDVKHQIFKLKPDLALTYSFDSQATQHCLILDAKWKLIDEEKGGSFDLAQSDFYQMFAYNHMYQGHQSDIVLIYPKHLNFNKALKPFHYNMHESFSKMVCPKVWVIPFDLEKGMLLLDCDTTLTGLKYLINS